MSRYLLSVKTEEDIEEIYRYGFFEYGEAAAEQYQESLGKKLQYLAENPLSCLQREEFVPVVRINHHRKHLVVYSAEADHVLIIRILGDRMDISKNLSN
jgi:toxin ParE1/3/4